MFYDKRNAAAIATLLPAVQAKATLVLQECEQQGIWLLAIEGRRSWARQAWLYASHRYRPGPILTDAKPGYSLHEYGAALDFIPTDAQGGLHWNDNARIQQIAQIAKTHGFEWGGDWPGYKDWDHIQYTAGHDINWFRAGNRL